MPTVHSTISYTYATAGTTPVGFEVTFAVYDTAAGGGAGKTFVTLISIDPAHAVYWSLDGAYCTGLSDGAGGYIRHPAHTYDSSGITATWTERISDNPLAPTRYILRAKYASTSGLISVQAECTQLDDTSNSASLLAGNTTTLSVPIPASPAI